MQHTEFDSSQSDSGPAFVSNPNQLRWSPRPAYFEGGYVKRGNLDCIRLQHGMNAFSRIAQATVNQLRPFSCKL